MELSQIRYFIRLAEMLSFTEAAKASFVTQSALSVSIKQLEEELGVRLFDRIGKKVFLTDYGKLFLGYARNAVDSLQDGVRELNALNNVFKGKLHIGVTYSMSELLKSHLLSFTEKYPTPLKTLYRICCQTAWMLLLPIVPNSYRHQLPYSLCLNIRCLLLWLTHILWLLLRKWRRQT